VKVERVAWMGRTGSEAEGREGAVVSPRERRKSRWTERQQSATCTDKEPEVEANFE